MEKPKFVYVSYIATTPEKLWQALTDGEFTRRYWGGRRIQSDWNVGSPVKHLREDGGIDWQGEVLKSERPLYFLIHSTCKSANNTATKPMYFPDAAIAAAIPKKRKVRVLGCRVNISTATKKSAMPNISAVSSFK